MDLNYLVKSRQTKRIVIKCRAKLLFSYLILYIMLYVILTPQMDKDRNFCYSVKFGYSKDFNRIRKAQYEAYFWNFEILHIYEQGDEELERRIKYHLKNYLLFGKEWFEYCPEVINFFNNNNTYEKLKAVGDSVILPDTESKFKRLAKNKVNMQVVQYVYEKVFIKENLDVRIGLEKELIQNLKRYKPKEQIRYVIKKYSLNEKDLGEYIKNQKTDLSKSLELANEFNTNNNVVEKLKFLVKISEDSNISKEEFFTFLNFIPARFKNYYIELGSDRIKANSYQESKLKDEWNKKRQEEEGISEELVNEILSFFKLGQRYTNPDIKAKLKELYQKYSYDRTAKASDLEEYFWLKKVYLPSIKKNGFEIQKKR